MNLLAESVTVRARVSVATLCVALLLVPGTGGVGAQQLTDARAALRTGRYDDAIAQLTRLARGNDSPEASRWLVRALVEVGRYRPAEEAARRFTAANPRSAALFNALGEVLVARGKVEEAEAAFARAIAEQASDSLKAELNLAMLRYERGEREEAMQTFDRFVDFYNNAQRLSSEELAAVASAARYLGVRNPQLFKDALRVYDEAIAVDPDNVEPRVAVGELFLEKYQSPDAKAAFDEVLALNASHPRALLGLARSYHFDGSPEALETARKSLDTNPNLVPARTFVARLHLEAEDYEAALEEANRALEVDPTSREAFAVIAAVRYVQGDVASFEEARRRAFTRNSVDAEFYNTLAEVSARNRLYHDAASFASEAVELDETSWEGFGLLGMNQLRIGEIEQGRTNLETAFEGDPYHIWIKNTLDLLDTFDEYSVTTTERFQLVLHESEAELLAPYVTQVAEEAYGRLSTRYGYQPATPIRLEVYPRHADFSVRTVGLAGLGALGVSFGPVLAMDSPSARERGTFNWGSTLWHEVAHTFHLGMSGHKVPRWFTEGLAVFEERRARSGWGDDVSVGFLMAYRQDRLLPVSRLNNGFVRPAYPQQVVYSYYQASLVCELIEQEFGFQALLGMLEGFKEGQTTPQVFHSVLGMDVESFDDRFTRHFEDRFAGPLSALRSATPLEEGQQLSHDELAQRASAEPGNFLAQLSQGRLLFAEEKHDEALPYFERARDLFPGYAGQDTPYWYVALIHKAKGNTGKAVAALQQLIDINANHYQAHVELATLREEIGDATGAAAALNGVMYIYPFEMSLHSRLAELYGNLGQHNEGVRERLAVVALEPVDRAEARYRLARAYADADSLRDARREVLRALEIAPGFEDAQVLLLEIRDRLNRTPDSKDSP